MPVRLRPTTVIKAKLGLGYNGELQTFYTATCAKHMDKYVPMRSGELARYKIIDDFIVYDQPYAQYQWRGMRFNGTHVIDPANRDRSKHPLATSYWDRKMWSAEGEDIIKECQEKLGGKK